MEKKNNVEIGNVNSSLLDAFRCGCVVMSHTGRVNCDFSFWSVLIKFQINASAVGLS
jgi:hypothetical protein